MTRDQEAAVGNRTRRLLECSMALATMLLGLQLTAFPEDVMRPGGALDLLSALMPAPVWTLGFIILGSMRLVVCIINGYWPLSPHVRWAASAMTLVLVWLPLAVGYWLNLPDTKGFPALILGPIALLVEATSFYALSVIRAGRNRGGT
jgi:hypothetical protein